VRPGAKDQAGTSFSFAGAAAAGEFAFATSGRHPQEHVTGSLVRQADLAAARLGKALAGVGVSLDDLVNLVVYVTDYSTVPLVSKSLRRVISPAHRPAMTFVGVPSLPSGEYLSLDAVATSGPKRAFMAGRTTAVSGSDRGWADAVVAGGLCFFSGCSGGPQTGSANPLVAQTTAAMALIEEILSVSGYALGDVFRTHVFRPQHAPTSEPDPRRERYRTSFAEGTYPANSVLGICSIGPEILLRISGIASRRPKRYITSPAVRDTSGIYSQAVHVDGFVFLAGQDATSAAADAPMPRGIERQARVALEHVRELIQAAGGSLADVVKLTVYVVSGCDSSSLSEVLTEFFPVDRPRPSGLEVHVRDLAADALVEIDAVAHCPA
jgi:2-iminobutanoate/2-iminopropanoate deaminase